MLYKKKVLKLVFSKPMDFNSTTLFIDHKLLNIFDLCKYKTLIFMHRIYYKTYSPIIYKHYKRITKKINARSTFDVIQPYNKYNYMNNSLTSYGPRLWNHLHIDKRQLVAYLFPFSVIIFLIIF